MKDNFSTRAELYAKYRPHYPQELFDCIISHVKENELAWDCGTGNGQSAIPLSRHLKKVFATDISQKQISKAPQKENIIYALEPAEKTSLAEGSVDLVTVAQAIHWFRFNEFYAEVRRVAKPGAVIAVWTYNLLKISKEIDGIIYDHHFKMLGDYWDPERKYVDENYATIPFPFQEIKTPEFRIEVNWSLADLEGYLNTWSALQKFITANSYNPVGDLVNEIKKQWGDAERRNIYFPVYMRLGTVK
jgi:SAM-dependent methyltransferase